jgi:hypothetical protein
MNMRLAAVLLTLILILISSGSVFADNFQWAGMGSLFAFASDNGPVEPPAILPSLGFSASWQIFGPLRIEPTLDIYYSNYKYNGYPIACSLENRSAFVIGFVTAVQLTGSFALGNNGTVIRVYGGPAADFRLVLPAFGLPPNELEDAQQQAAYITDYFWGDARWFLPVFGVGMDFPINEHFLIGFDLRAWFPVYKLWTNDNTPDIDGWRFGIGFRITPRPVW